MIDEVVVLERKVCLVLDGGDFCLLRILEPVVRFARSWSFLNTYLGGDTKLVQKQLLDVVQACLPVSMIMVGSRHVDLLSEKSQAVLNFQNYRDI